MSVIAGIAGIVSAATALGSGIGAGVQGAKSRKRAEAAEKSAARNLALRKNLLTRNVAEEMRVRTRAMDQLQARGEASKAAAIQSLLETGQKGVLGGITGVLQKSTDIDQSIMTKMDEALQAQQALELEQEQLNVDEMGRILEAEVTGASEAAQQARLDQTLARQQMLSAFGSLAASTAQLEPLVASTRSEDLGFKVFQDIGKNPFAVEAILGEGFAPVQGETSVEENARLMRIMKGFQGMTPQELRAIRAQGFGGVGYDALSGLNEPINQ